MSVRTPHLNPIERVRSRELLLAQQSRPSQIHRKDQYESLFRFYAEENERYEALNKRGSAYLGVVGGLSVFAMYKLDAISAKILAHPPTLILGLFTGAAIIACILFITLSLRIREYSTVIDVRSLVVNASNENYESEDFYTLLLGGLVVAIENNRNANNARADQLTTAVWLAVTAIILSLITNIAIFQLAT